MQRQGISLLKIGRYSLFFCARVGEKYFGACKKDASQQGAGQASGSEKTSKTADDKKWKYGQSRIREFFQS